LKEPTVTTILNVLWLIFGGWISGLLWTLAGCVLAITIIGLPWTPAAFRMASFSFWPFGRHIVDKPTGQDLSLVLNIIWLVFAGWWLALHHVILAVMLGVTIIGIPFALQHLKLAGISLMPVGKDVIEV
jgi:uncharacterized membrane protein YccF (DUF307 family)